MAADQIIAVMGGTGSQGGGVVDALLERGQFGVRVLTRNPQSDKGTTVGARGSPALPLLARSGLPMTRLSAKLKGRVRPKTAVQGTCF